MGIILGCFCLLCACLLLAKALTRKFNMTKTDAVLKKLHKPLCAALLVLSIIHLASVLSVFKTRSILVYITGAAAIILFVLIILLYHTRKQAETKWLHLHRILACLMLLCITGHIAVYFVDFSSYQKKIESINLHAVDMSNIEDGVYIGEYDAGFIYARVQVAVSDGEIQDIVIMEHENERGGAAESVVSNILDAGAFPVDAVSGATNSSKVIQQSIQNALEGE